MLLWYSVHLYWLPSSELNSACIFKARGVLGYPDLYACPFISFHMEKVVGRGETLQSGVRWYHMGIQCMWGDPFRLRKDRVGAYKGCAWEQIVLVLCRACVGISVLELEVGLTEMSWGLGGKKRKVLHIAWSDVSLWQCWLEMT